MSSRSDTVYPSTGGRTLPPGNGAQAAHGRTDTRKRKGKGSRLDGERTRRAILDAAEYLFSLDGLAGVSIRRITKHSGTDLASVNYYFNTKEGLFREVLVRRIEAMSSERMRSLASFEPVGDVRADVERVLDLFVAPLFGSNEEECESLANYRRLVSLVTNSKTWQNAIFRDHYDPTASAYIRRLEQLLPGLTSETVCWSFNFFLGALTNAMAETGRVDRLSGGQCRSADLLMMKRQLLGFTASSLVGLAKSGDTR